MKAVTEFVSRHPRLLLAGMWTVSRALLYFFFPFRTDFLPWLNQLLDINLLRTDLWHSLSLLHVTPPLYDAFIGLVVSSFPENLWGITFSVLYFLMGLSMVLITYRVITYLKAPWWAGFLGGALFIVNPVLFRFEIIPFYTYPLAFFLLLSVYALIVFIEKPTLLRAAFFLLLPLITLLFRNFFHIIVYFIPVAVGFLFLVYTKERRLFASTLLIALIFFGIGLVPSIRNEITYGTFTSSTWQGMQLFSMTYFVPKENIKALVDEGVVTPLALVPRFQNPDIYYDYYKTSPAPGEPVLNAVFKSAGGGAYGNFNNIIYVRTALEYQKDTWAILSRYPEYFIPRFINSTYIFFGFANYRYFDETPKWFIFDGSLLKRTYEAGKYFIEPALYALLFAFILWESGRAILKNSRNDESVVLLYLLFILLYTCGVANVVELGENYTARVPIDPLVTLLAIVFGYGIVRRIPRTPPRAETSKNPQ